MSYHACRVAFGVKRMCVGTARTMIPRRRARLPHHGHQQPQHKSSWPLEVRTNIFCRSPTRTPIRNNHYRMKPSDGWSSGGLGSPTRLRSRHCPSPGRHDKAKNESRAELELTMMVRRCRLKVKGSAIQNGQANPVTLGRTERRMAPAESRTPLIPPEKQ
jgi:hypothetical protein